MLLQFTMCLQQLSRLFHNRRSLYTHSIMSMNTGKGTYNEMALTQWCKLAGGLTISLYIAHAPSKTQGRVCPYIVPTKNGFKIKGVNVHLSTQHAGAITSICLCSTGISWTAVAWLSTKQNNNTRNQSQYTISVNTCCWRLARQGLSLIKIVQYWI